MDMYILLYLKWITNKDLRYSTGSSAQCCVAAWMGGEFGGERTHLCVWLHHSPGSITAFLTGFSPRPNKKLKNIKVGKGNGFLPKRNTTLLTP